MAGGGRNVAKRKTTLEKAKQDITIKPSRTEKPTPETIRRVQEGSKMLADGASRESVIRFYEEKYDLENRQARDYYYAAIRSLLPQKYDEWREGMIATNIARLESIIESEMKEGGNKKLAKEAIDSINKVLGAGQQGITVGIQNNKEDDTQQIIVRFDG